MKIKSAAFPLVTLFALAVTGCAARSVHINEVPKAIDACRSETQKIYTKGKEELGRENIKFRYDKVCGAHQVEIAKANSAALIEQTRIQAESAILIATLKAAPDDKTRAELARQIIERMDSQNPDVSGAQKAANDTEGLDETDLRKKAAAAIKCKPVTDARGIMTIVCN